MHASPVARNDNPHHDDQDNAAREHSARRLLAHRTGLDLHRHTAIQLLEAYAVWSGQVLEQDHRDAALAALTLLPAARAEMEALESGVLYAAKSAGLTWTQMAAPLGLSSPQAAQQRLDRLAARQARP